MPKLICAGCGATRDDPEVPCERCGIVDVEPIKKTKTKKK